MPAFGAGDTSSNLVGGILKGYSGNFSLFYQIIAMAGLVSAGIRDESPDYEPADVSWMSVPPATMLITEFIGEHPFFQ